jgi:hypothetical protein
MSGLELWVRELGKRRDPMTGKINGFHFCT